MSLPVTLIDFDNINFSFSIERVKLRDWTSLEGIKKTMDDAISKKDSTLYFSSVVKFIEIALSTKSTIDWSKIYWMDTLNILDQVLKVNSTTIEFPLLQHSHREQKKLPWEYDGRSWYFWFNIFAKNYGWSEETIANLDIDTAIGLYQEILIDEQIQQEWQWGLSEIAYPYNSSTKKQEFKALERPDWMKPIIPKEVPKIKIRKDMIPMGKVVRSVNEL